MNEWTQSGPDGGTLCSLVAAPSDPSILYARGGTVFRSTDSGVTWESRGGLVDPVPCYLQVDVGDPQRLYGIRAGELLRSLDGGTTWDASGDGLPTLQTEPRVEVDLHDADFLIFVTQGQIFRSRDRADSWQTVPGPAGATVRQVYVDSAVAGSLWLLGAEGGIYRSADQGETWVPLSSDLPAALVPLSMKLDPQHAELRYLSTGAGAFRTWDGGTHWTPIFGPSIHAIGADSRLYSLATSPFSFPQVYRSDDFGDSWQLLPGRPFSFVPIPGAVQLTATPNAVFGWGSLDLVRSLDHGNSWAGSHRGLQASSVEALALDHQKPDSIYGIRLEANRAERLVYSLDRGRSWLGHRVAPAQGIPFLTSLAIDPSDSEHMLATTALSSSSELNGLLRTTNGGFSWSFLEFPGTCLRGAGIEFDPTRPTRVLISAGHLAPLCGETCPNRISDDGGESWRCFDLTDPEDRSLRLTPSPFEEGVILAMGHNGLYRSANSGEAWARVAEPPAGTTDFFTDVVWASAETAYATSAGSWLYASEDAGTTWHPHIPFPDDVPDRPWLTSLAVDPFRPQTIYALSQSGPNDPPREVVLSADGGLTWFALPYGLAGWELSDLTIDPVTPNRLYVSANGGGVLSIDLQVPEECLPSATALCIQGGRFRIESRWRDFAGRFGFGHTTSLSADTGAFWFFDPANLELFVKEIDGRDYNDAFWTFYGSLSNVEFTVLATDTWSGAQHGYFNPSRQFASRGDIESFPQGVGLGGEPNAAQPAIFRVPGHTVPQRSSTGCAPNATTLCLRGGRFAASVTWQDFTGHSGTGTPLPLTPDTGSFWFFDAGIHELAVKVIDGQDTNGAFWVFYGALSNVAFELTVVDTVTGESWTRSNPSGTFASGGDIGAFPQLP